MHHVTCPQDRNCAATEFTRSRAVVVDLTGSVAKLETRPSSSRDAELVIFVLGRSLWRDDRRTALPARRNLAAAAAPPTRASTSAVASSPDRSERKDVRCELRHVATRLEFLMRLCFGEGPRARLMAVNAMYVVILARGGGISRVWPLSARTACS